MAVRSTVEPDVPSSNLRDRRFKLEAVVGANSGTAREADYVEFKTMEKIYSTDNPPRVLFDKGTSIFGLVTHRKKRQFPFRVDRSNCDWNL